MFVVVKIKYKELLKDLLSTATIMYGDGHTRCRFVHLSWLIQRPVVQQLSFVDVVHWYFPVWKYN